MNKKEFHNILFENLNNIYSYILSPKEISMLTKKVLDLSSKVKPVKNNFLSQEDVILVTYSDSID